MKRRTHSVACTLSLLLTACLGGGQEAEPDRVGAARSGVRVSLGLMEAEWGRERLPASRAGTRAGVILSAIGMGADAIPGPPEHRQADDAVGADTRLIETFLQLLRTDVPELLNRSVNREKALEEYVASLSSHTERGRVRLRELQDRENALRDDERRLERGVRDIGDELDEAIRGGEAGRSSSLANDLVDRQSALTEAQGELVVVSRLRESYEGILPSLEERLKAVKANREPLVKGVRVVDIPGVEDLKIIILEEGRLRVRRRR